MQRSKSNSKKINKRIGTHKAVRHPVIDENSVKHDAMRSGRRKFGGGLGK